MPVKPPGSDFDLNGCINSAGYVWCQILGRCNLVNGEIGPCTMMYCFTNNSPECVVFAPGVPNIMPVVDPYPVINPFIGDGH